MQASPINASMHDPDEKKGSEKLPVKSGHEFLSPLPYQYILCCQNVSQPYEEATGRKKLVCRS
jgi:hypothetical protein